MSSQKVVILDGQFQPYGETNPLAISSSGLVNFVYDYVSVNYATATTEIYTFKTGGSSGTTTGVITLTYTDSTKDNLSSAERA